MFRRFSTLYILILFFINIDAKVSGLVNPPHCTRVTKNTDYPANFKYDYPTVYIPPGQREAYQHLFCINPPAVNSASSVVCDWTAPPQVAYTLGDEYMHVIRLDPSGKYLGNAIIVTHQVCTHDKMVNESSPVFSARLYTVD